ncbi:MAG TPA: hypothetical protein VFS90_03345 [Pyrinomonadaceae bacterium]|nr:hypothetical protein [Pyrinomonadaceae bacterium]
MNGPPSSLAKSIATGAIGFGLVSLCVFATVAFAERWMFQNLGLFGSYITWIVLFILLSGVVFGSLVVVDRWRLPKFYLLWAVAFFAYAAAWMIAYFSLGRTLGELIGALAGSVLMALVIATGFRTFGSIVKLSAVLFVSNTLGYFLGVALFDSLSAPAGMLLFGVVYGLFFGAGIGAALQLAQSNPNV